MFLRFPFAYQTHKQLSLPCIILKMLTKIFPRKIEEELRKRRDEKFYCDFVVVAVNFVVTMIEFKKKYKTLQLKSIKENERELLQHTLLNVSSIFKTSSLVLLVISSK